LFGFSQVFFVKGVSAAGRRMLAIRERSQRRLRKIALTELSIEFLRKAEAAEQAADKPTDENLGERV
jgi:hypothetical protein